MSHDFWKFMVHDFLKINVPRFFEIHSPRFFEIHSPRFFGIQCPTIFCDFGLFNSLAQAGGGGAYYMIFHYQKHTVLNYYHRSGSRSYNEQFSFQEIRIHFRIGSVASTIGSANPNVEKTYGSRASVVNQGFFRQKSLYELRDH